MFWEVAIHRLSTRLRCSPLVRNNQRPSFCNLCSVVNVLSLYQHRHDLLRLSLQPFESSVTGLADHDAVSPVPYPLLGAVIYDNPSSHVPKKSC